MTFSEQKHAYVLSFPWNYPEIIGNYEDAARSAQVSGFWNRFANNSGAMVDFNNLFREFHQFCALPSYTGLEKICEGRLAHAVNESIKRIHFHGLDIEMANLTVEQPRIQVIKVEVDHGLSLQRDANMSLSDYQVTESSIMGAPIRYYVPKNDDREFIDGLNEDNRPYNVSVTCLVESPMKLYVENQNFSSVLFGSTDEELVKNVVRFEANVQWSDLLRQLPVNNKPSMGWKITDFNNIMNENAHFDGESSGEPQSAWVSLL